MAAKGKRKLVDIGPDHERLVRVLERWLVEHHIPYKRHHLEPAGLRYYVDSVDLNAAQAILPALQEIARCFTGGTGGTEKREAL